LYQNQTRANKKEKYPQKWNRNNKIATANFPSQFRQQKNNSFFYSIHLNLPIAEKSSGVSLLQEDLILKYGGICN
jgi:hypothetical protein